MRLLNFVLTLHILGAVFGFGPAMLFSMVVPATAERHPQAAGVLMRMVDRLDRKWFLPIDIIQPLTGAWLILITKDLWDPFEHRNRWLLASIVLYVVLMILIYAVVAPIMHRVLPVVEREGFNDTVKKMLAPVNRLGPLLGAILMTILILMIVKPGSGVFHP